MPFNKEKAEKNLKEILEKMQGSTDAVLLHEYYKMFKKEISFFRRSMAAAWLFMYYDGKEFPQKSKASYKKTNDCNVDASAKPHDDSVDSDNSSERSVSFISLPEEEAKHLFISIGKNRRLFPKEVITMIMTKTSAAREDIGVIRILDNYSFVQVKDTKADEIIEALTGCKFRGRTLVVNYAKPKTGENEDSEGNNLKLE